MNQFEVAQGFIEQCQAGAPVVALARSFQRCAETLGFRHFACCSHVDPLKRPRRAVMLHSYPKEWATLFSELELFEVDPVFLHASRSLVPFFWNTQPDCEALKPAAYLAVQLMSFYMYEAVSKDARERDPPPVQKPLSPRERQCLELAAQGKSDWVSSKILGLSERTVHNHVENAKRRLQVATRMQAVIHALAGQQISLGDVVRCYAQVLAASEPTRLSRTTVKSRTKAASH